MSESVKNSGTPARPSLKIEKILIRPWPKVIFMYPPLIAALVGWFASILTEGADTSGSGTIGAIFCAVFFMNLLVFAFDFSRIKSITILVGGIAVVFLLLWANGKWEVMTSIENILGSIEIRMNTQFYGFMSFFFCFIFLLVFINTRFNYYEVNRNEILHHHGYLCDIIRTPTTAMRMISPR